MKFERVAPLCYMHVVFSSIILMARFFSIQISSMFRILTMPELLCALLHAQEHIELLFNIFPLEMGFLYPRILYLFLY